MSPLPEAHREQIENLCDMCKVKELYFFGSITDAERFRKESDIDVFVSFQEDLPPEEYVESFFDLLFGLEEILGRDIDIITEKSLSNPFFQDNLDSTKVIFYDNTTMVDG